MKSSVQPDPMRLIEDGRAILVGQTGSGKTTLAKYLVAQRSKYIVIDSKHEIELDKARVLYDHGLGRRIGRMDRLIWRVPADITTMELDEALYDIFERGSGYTIYFDELYLICKSSMSYPAYLRALYTQGRSRGIGVVGTTQRPSHIPLFALSECNQFYKFSLRLRKDQVRMAEFMGEEVLEPPSYPEESCHPSPHSFWYYEVGMRSPKLYRLELRKGEEE